MQTASSGLRRGTVDTTLPLVLQFCQHSFPEGTGKLLLQIDQMIRRARQKKVWRIVKLDCDLVDVIFLAGTDGSLANMP